MVFVEAYAGTAAVTLALFGKKAPLSRPGNKNKLANEITRYIASKPQAVILADSDPNIRALLQTYFDRKLHILTRDQLYAWNKEDPRTLWNACVKSVKTGSPSVAAFLVAATWAVSKGAGASYSYAGPGKVTRSGLIPAHVRCTANIADRLPLLTDVDATILDNAHAALALVNNVSTAVVYFDPPYTDVQDKTYNSSGNYSQALRLIDSTRHPCLMSSGRKLSERSKRIGSNSFMGMSASKKTKREEYLTLWARGLPW